MASAATWNVLPVATEIGWPFQLPYHTRTGTESTISSDAVDHAVPPVVYPDPPVSSVPAAVAELAEENSFSFIAPAPSATNDVPGTPAVPDGVSATRIRLYRVWSSAFAMSASAHGRHRNRPRQDRDHQRTAHRAARVIHMMRALVVARARVRRLPVMMGDLAAARARRAGDQRVQVSRRAARQVRARHRIAARKAFRVRGR